MHYKDHVQVPDVAPDVHLQFMLGNFAVNRTTSPFSAMAVDQPPEQNNGLIRGGAGMVGLTTLRVWRLLLGGGALQTSE